MKTIFVLHVDNITHRVELIRPRRSRRAQKQVQGLAGAGLRVVPKLSPSTAA